MIRVELDTNVLISATFWRGASFQITCLAIEKKITCFSSLAILDEYARILARDFKLNQTEVERRLSAVTIFQQIVNPSVKINLVKDDPDDNKIIETAIESNAGYIATNDKHLLKIDQYQKTKIVTPAEFLKTIKL